MKELVDRSVRAENASLDTQDLIPRGLKNHAESLRISMWFFDPCASFWLRLGRVGAKATGSKSLIHKAKAFGQNDYRQNDYEEIILPKNRSA